jgi:hypothetical protein
MKYRIKIYTTKTCGSTKYSPQRRKHWWNKWTFDCKYDLYAEWYSTMKEAIDKIDEWKKEGTKITYESVK